MSGPLSGEIANPGGVYRRLLGYARPHLGMFMIGVGGMALFAATDSAMAYLVKIFLGGAFVNPDPRIVWLVPVGAVVLFLLRGIGDYVSNYFPGWVGRQIIKALRAELFAHYLRLPTAFHDGGTSGQTLSRLTYNVELVAEATTSAVTVLIRDTLTLLGLLATLFYFNWQLAAFALTLAPLISWLIQSINRSFRRYSARIQASMGDVTRVAKEAIDAHRLIKIFNAEAYEERVFGVANELNRHTNMRLIAARAISNPVVQLIAAFGLAGVIYFAIRQVFSKEMRVDEFMAFLTALLLMTAPLRRLVNVFGPLQQGIAAGASVFDILDQPVESPGGALTIQRARGEVEFREVSFTYGADKGLVLDRVSAHIPAGKLAAIVGKSGSGKSTLVSLLPRFYDPTSGSVRVDGADVAEYRRADLRRQISVVSQDVVLFNDTIRNNIAFNLADPRAPDVERAAQAAYVMEFAAEMPLGLDTVVGDRGSLLSGGQRQRVSIARALLKNAPILILDEAFSALDTESESRIQVAVADLMRDRTTLVIAHRLSTVESADIIFVLNEGRIVDTGTHAQLMQRDGVYQQLYRLQFNA